MSINWWMDKEDVIYIYNEVLLGNEKERNLAFCSNVDGTGECYAKWNKPYRERQIPYVFTLMWILRNLTEDHRGGEGKKKRGREPNHKRLLKIENKLKVDGGWEGGWWALKRAPVGMSTGCCIETNVTINFTLKKHAIYMDYMYKWHLLKESSSTSRGPHPWVPNFNSTKWQPLQMNMCTYFYVFAPAHAPSDSLPHSLIP